MATYRNTQALKLAVSSYWEQAKATGLDSAIGLFLPGIGTILVTYAPPLIVASILGKFSTDHNFALNQLLPYIFIFTGLWVTGEILWRIGIHYAIKAETRSIKRLYIETLEKLMAKDLKFFHDNFAGALTKKAIGYGRRYEDVYDNFLFSIIPSVLPLIFIAIVLWRYSYWLVIVLIGLLVMTGLIIVPLIKRRQKLVTVREEASNVMAGHLADAIANVDAVKAFAHEDYEQKLHIKYVSDYMAKSKKSWDYHNLVIDSVTSPFYVLTNTIGLVVAIVASQNLNINIQVVFITFTYYAAATRVMWEFNRIYRNLESALSDAAQFSELLLDEPALCDPSEPKKLAVSSGEVEFKEVNFKYQDAGKEYLFDSLNLKIRGGEKVALVGHSGGGKTTITKLILRFMDINSGQILIDNQNIAEVKQADLRSNVAYVPQEPIMFHRSLTENIQYGRLDATEAEVKKVAKLAHAEEFIEKLPNKFETLVGERGVKLSGGQRQRIAIARAMIKNSPILVLDEATSALDSESEKLIQDALWQLMEGRTAIVIAHRLSTVQKMDRIIVMENGQIVEQGTHKELLDKKGVYANLWAHQSGGFLEE